MAQFLVLTDYQDTQRKLPAATLVDDSAYNMTQLREAGLAAVLYDPATMEVLRTRFLTQKANEFAKPDLMLLVLLSNAGASAVFSSTGQTVEARL